MKRRPRGALAARGLALLALSAALASGCSHEKREREPEPEHAAASVDRPGAAATPGANRAKSAPAATSGQPIDSMAHEQVVRARTESGRATEIRLKAPAGWQIQSAPATPDPHGGRFTLKEATAGLKGKGALVARIATSAGSFYCDLFPQRAPNTVANFVGLARGKRAFWDGDKSEWVKRPYYDGTSFHRVIPGFMIQGGDHTNTGTGTLGYHFADEVNPGDKHDRAGLLCMANRKPNVNASQFFITQAPAPHLDGSYTIFGQCQPVALVSHIARAPQSGPPRNRPVQPVVIETVEIKRVKGGAASWMPSEPEIKAIPGVPAAGRAVEIEPSDSP